MPGSSRRRAARSLAGALGAVLLAGACTAPEPSANLPRLPASPFPAAGEGRGAGARDTVRSLGCRASTWSVLEEAVAGEPVPVGTDVVASPTSARPTGAFVESVGVNIHSTYTDTPYADHTKLLEVLDSAGIRHVRDQLIPTLEKKQATFIARLGARGGCANLVVGGEGVRPEEIRAAVGVLTEVADAVASAEGPNELDLAEVTDWDRLAAQQQRLLHDEVRSEARLRELPLLGPSVGRPDSFRELGDVSQTLDALNLHPYPGGWRPEGAIGAHRAAGEVAAADAPVVLTETGYHDAVVDDESQAGVPEDVEATYLPRLLLDAFDRGVARTYLYELVDEFPDDDDDQASFGLYRRDWSPKPAARSVGGLLALLGSRPSSTTRDLAVAARTDDESLRTVLLNDDEGFWLALWREVPVYEPRTRQRLQTEDVEVEVLVDEATDMALYRSPADGGPSQDAEGVRSLAVDVGATPVLLRLQPVPPG